MSRTASHIILTLSLLLCSWTVLTAQVPRFVPDSAAFTVSFRQSKWRLDRSSGDNSSVLDSIGQLLSSIRRDSLFRLRRVSFVGGASPEGSLSFNRLLSERRARSLFEYLESRGLLDGSGVETSFLFLGRDWEGVYRLAAIDDSLPYREETTALLRSLADGKRRSGSEPARSLELLKRLRYGVPYLHLYRHVFPSVRASRLVVCFDRLPRTFGITPPRT